MKTLNLKSLYQKIFWRKLLIYRTLVIFLVFGIIAGCFDKGNACENNQEKGSIISFDDSIQKNQPKVEIKVNKQYDDNGNIISYDSTYSYSYSNSGDSMSNNFLNNQGMFLNFRNPFFSHPDDTINQNIPDFFNDNFFGDQMKETMKMFEKMEQQMKSMQNFQQQFFNIPFAPPSTNPQKQNLNSIGI